jgi:quercetin dioxygenase-like cupin family protein
VEEQKVFVLAGVVMKQQLSGEQTNGTFSLFENRSGGQSRTPIHVHANDDETLFIIEGEMQVISAGTAHTMKAGQSIFLPRGIPHQILNTSGSPSHYMLLCTPSGFEGFLADGGHLKAPDEKVGPPTPADVERMKAAAPRYGITFLPGW